MADEKKLTRITLFADDVGVLDRVEVLYQVRDPNRPDYADWRSAPDKNYYLDDSGDGKDIPVAIKTLMQDRVTA